MKAAIKFGFDLPEWKGLSFVELLSEEVRKDYFEGHLRRGSMILPGFETRVNANLGQDRQLKLDGPIDTRKHSGDELEETVNRKLSK